MNDNEPISVHSAVPTVLSALKQRHQAVRGQLLILLGAGLPLSLIGPLLFGTLFILPIKYWHGDITAGRNCGGSYLSFCSAPSWCRCCICAKKTTLLRKRN